MTRIWGRSRREDLSRQGPRPTVFRCARTHEPISAVSGCRYNIVSSFQQQSGLSNPCHPHNPRLIRPADVLLPRWLVNGILRFLTRGVAVRISVLRYAARQTCEKCGSQQADRQKLHENSPRLISVHFKVGFMNRINRGLRG